MEVEMCQQMTWIEDIRTWSDGIDREWRKPLGELCGQNNTRVLGVEQMRIPPLISSFLHDEFLHTTCVDAAWVLGEIRMIKSPEEIDIMRQAGQVAIAMVEAARNTIAEGVPEYEVTLAATAAGTRKAAGLLSHTPLAHFFSPTIYNLHVLQSGHETSMVHRRSSVRRIQRGDPVYLCFCGLANFKQYKLGFDREFFVQSVSDEQSRMYEVAVNAQVAALESIRPGITAEDVHFAAEAIYRDAGFEPGYRTGRSIGCSFLEMPEFKAGDKTVLQTGMTFAVDGGITISHEFGARVGDSIVVTDAGFEFLTPYPKDMCIL
jgi:Xaa-Pro aminopeptidase